MKFNIAFEIQTPLKISCSKRSESGVKANKGGKDTKEKSQYNWVGRQLLRFCQDYEKGKLKKEDKETWFVVFIKAVKCIFQYAIGVGIFFLLFNKLWLYSGIEPLGVANDWVNILLKNYGAAPVLEIAGKGLMATTAIDLAYMLFTPGPDEAIEPLLTGIAAFVLLSLSEKITPTSHQNLLGVAALILCLPVLLWTKHNLLKKYN